MSTPRLSLSSTPSEALGLVSTALKGLSARLAGARAARGAPAPAAPASEGQRLRLAYEELRDLLDRHPDSRRTLRHLAFFEVEFARRGKRIFRAELPPELFHRVLQQLEPLLPAEPGEGLRMLRRRLEAARGGASAAARETEPQGMTVSEASHSLFDEMERSWTGEMPAASPGR